MYKHKWQIYPQGYKDIQIKIRRRYDYKATGLDKLKRLLIPV